MRLLFVGLFTALAACSSSEKGQDVVQDIQEETTQDVLLADMEDAVLELHDGATERGTDDFYPGEQGNEAYEDKGLAPDDGVSFVDKGGVDKDIFPGEDTYGDSADEVPTSAHYRGRVRALAMGDEWPVVPGVLVRALDPNTGWPLPNYVATSDSEGYVEFDFDWIGRVGFMMSKEDYVDTYQFDQMTDSADGDLQILPSGLANQVMSALGVQWVQGKGILAGNVEWRSSNSGGRVGCVTITAFPACDIFYFGRDGMPKPPESQSKTSSENGRFIAVNCEPANTHFEAKINGTTIGEGDAFIYADGITVSFTITIQSEFDPTPPDCPY